MANKSFFGDEIMSPDFSDLKCTDFSDTKVMVSLECSVLFPSKALLNCAELLQVNSVAMAETSFRS